MIFKTKYLRYMSLLIVFTFLGGCSTKTVNLTQEVKNNINNKTITFTNREKPIKPEVMTPSRALGMSGMVGFLDSLVLSFLDKEDKKYKTTDVPSSYINRHLADKLISKYDMKYIHHENSMKDDSIDKIISQYNNSDFILDTETYYWYLLYYPTHWNKYRIAIYNRVKMIDAKNHKVVAEKTCVYNPDYEEGMPSYEEMFENNGKLIKEGTKEALDRCIEELETILIF